MKIIQNKFIPFKGFKAINLFGFLFTKKPLNNVDINHEAIHTAQMKELFYIGFYIWYLIEWIILLVRYKNSHFAYRRIRFEQEAYNHESDLCYLSNRVKYNYI